jgi:hypothetical protein
LGIARPGEETERAHVLVADREAFIDEERHAVLPGKVPKPHASPPYARPAVGLLGRVVWGGMSVTTSPLRSRSKPLARPVFVSAVKAFIARGATPGADLGREHVGEPLGVGAGARVLVEAGPALHVVGELVDQDRRWGGCVG